MKEDIEKVLSQILIDCQMALDNTWDRSDDGFIAIQENIYDIASKYDLQVDGTYTVDCSHCENGTQHLSNYITQVCDYCNGTGEIEK